MQIDEEYLESLLNSIEPLVNPEGTSKPEAGEVVAFEEERLEDSVVEPLEAGLDDVASLDGEVTGALSEIEDNVSVQQEEISVTSDMNVSTDNAVVTEDNAAVTEDNAAVTEDASNENATTEDGANQEEVEAVEELAELLAAPEEKQASEPLDDLTDLEALINMDSDTKEEEAEVSNEELARSLSEIDVMLEAAKIDDDSDSIDLESSDEDLLALLAGSGDEDLDAIQNLLQADEVGEAVDVAALMEATEIEDVASSVLEASDKDSKKDKKKGKGFFANLIEMLTEPIDEAEEQEALAEGMETGISDENKEILEEIDKEKGKKKSKKVKKDKKKKKEVKSEGEEELSDEDEEKASDKKKKKKEKKPKVKKVKEDVPAKPEKRLPKKKVIVTILLCLSIMMAILVCVFGLNSLINLRAARWAFDNQDYKTTYENLYGLKLGEDDTLIYNKSKTILTMNRRYDSYKNYNRLGMKSEALNSLLEGVRLYPDIREKAVLYGVEATVDGTYAEIINALSGYGLSEESAKEIIGYESPVKYNERIYSIVNNTPFTYDEEKAADLAIEEEVVKPTVSDILPEEKDFLPDNPESIFEEPEEEVIDSNN